MRAQRGGRPPPPPVRQLLRLLRQQQGGRGAGSLPVQPSPNWEPSAPPRPRPGPPQSATGRGSPGLGGGQASAPPALPVPYWSRPGGVTGSQLGGTGQGALTFDPEPDPQELEAARSLFGAMEPWELLREDQDGDTLLHVLCARGLRGPARAAAEAFRRLGRLEAREHRGKTPLLVAVAAAAPGVVWDLLALGADPNGADRGGRTPLHLAATYGLPRVIQAVMASGVPVNLEARNFEGQTPLHCAVLSHNASLQAGGEPPGGVSEGGPPPSTPQEHLLCVELLLSMGADCRSQELKSNQTVLHLAARAGNLPLLHLLLPRPGLAPSIINLQAHGNTALHMAAALPGGPCQEPLLRLLLAWGADPGIRNLEHDLPHNLLPPGPQGDQLRLLLRNRRGRRRPSSPTRK